MKIRSNEFKMVLLRAICLSLVAIILLCGCTDGMAGEDTMNNTEINTETGGDTVVTPIEDIVLAENGEAKYTIIYDVKSEDDVAVATYLRLKLRELTGISFKLVDHSQKDIDCEILVGSTVSRNQTEEIFAKLDQRKACAVAVSGDKVCVVGGERSYSVVAVMKFLNEIKWEAANKRLTLRGDLNYFSSTDKVYLEELMVTEEYVDVYQTIFGTYSTYREQRYDLLKTADKKDQILIEALIERMGNSAAFYEGSSSLLNTGYIRKLDTSDYSRAAKVINGELLIPKQFAESYFGKTLAADSDGYVNITALCNGSEEYSLYRGGKLYIVTPKAVEGFSDTAATVNGYTNAEYVSRMIEFFTTSETPEPNNNTEQTRVVIAHKPFPENLADWSIVPYDSLYTPCVLSVKENGIDTIYLCYEVNTAIGAFTGYGNKGNPKTYITKSVDGGKTWEAVCEINGMTYGQLMSVNDNIYVMGQNANNIACIAKLDSSRTSGYQIALLHSNISTTGGGPGTVVEKDGKIYRPYNASVYIADVGSDLMNQASWTLSKSARDYFNNDWVKKVIGKVPDSWSIMEPNMVIGPDGELYYFARIDGIGRNVAVMLKLKADGSFEYAGNNGIINIQTTWNRFCVRYDEVTRKYITLTCVYTCGEHDRARRTLAIQTSSDLVNWEVVDYVLVDREMVNPVYGTWFHGFQYVDFVIEGNDIILAVRESVGEANCYHDGTFITFYRMENFREVIS